jgi:glycosyltransferase involved in cell wall biosynthesis
MKILHLIHQYLPEDVGGTELYTRQLSTELAARGHQVHVFYRQPASAAHQAGESSLTLRQDPGGVQVRAAYAGPVQPARRFLDTFGQQALSRMFGETLAQVQPDLVHIQHMMGLPVSLVRQLQQLGIPYLITLHDYWWICSNAQLVTNYSGELCNGPRLWLNCGRCLLARAGAGQLWPLSPAVAPLPAARHLALRQVMLGAKRILPVSDSVARRTASLGLPGDKMQVIRHGINVPPGVKQAVRQPGERLRIGYVGNLAWQKGVHVLIEAVNRLPAEAVSLVILGDEARFPDYARDLRQGAAHPGIRFLGQIPHDDLWGHLQEMEVLVFPSLWYEGAGLVIQEAFATGLPVIASDLGAIPESIRDGVDGLLFPAGDSERLAEILTGLLEQPEIVTRLSQNIPPVRTIQQHVDEVEAVYRAMINVSRS